MSQCRISRQPSGEGSGAAAPRQLPCKAVTGDRAESGEDTGERVQRRERDRGIQCSVSFTMIKHFRSKHSLYFVITPCTCLPCLRKGVLSVFVSPPVYASIEGQEAELKAGQTFFLEECMLQHWPVCLICQTGI